MVNKQVIGVWVIEILLNWILKWRKLSGQIHITKTRLYNFDPLELHFYIVKLGFTGVCIIFLTSAQNIDYGYSLEPPHRSSSNEYPQSMIWAEIWKISVFLAENFQFLELKFSLYLNRRVFVMSRRQSDDIFSYFSQKAGFVISCNEMSNPVSWENKKNIPKCHLLIFLLRVLSVKG